jgi:hypothetical protein
MNITTEVLKFKRKVIAESQNWNNEEELVRFLIIDSNLPFGIMQDIFVAAIKITIGREAENAFRDFNFSYAQLLQILNLMEKYAANWSFY